MKILYSDIRMILENHGIKLHEIDFLGAGIRESHAIRLMIIKNIP